MTGIADTVKKGLDSAYCDGTRNECNSLQYAVGTPRVPLSSKHQSSLSEVVFVINLGQAFIDDKGQPKN